LWRLTADKIAEIFGTRVHRRMHGKLATIIDRVEHGHHVFRAYFKNAFLKQYEKFSTCLRNELVSNNLADFRLKKGLEHLDAVRARFQTITARFAGFQAQWLNVHVDFPLLQRLALPITVGAVRYPGIKIHEPRVIRLLEVLLHGGSHLGGWTAKQIHHAVLTTFHLTKSTYSLNQLRYDLRKLKSLPSRKRGAMDCYSGTAPATPTGSRRRASRWRCSSCSSTSGCAGPSPTAASITAPMPPTSRPANSKPPTTAPTKPSNTSSICLPPEPFRLFDSSCLRFSGLESSEGVERNGVPTWWRDGSDIAVLSDEGLRVVEEARCFRIGGDRRNALSGEQPADRLHISGVRRNPRHQHPHRRCPHNQRGEQ
jgi:hypothetical protein